LTKKIIKSETTQLVTIELVTGSGPKRNNSSEVRLTPSPAAKAQQENTMYNKNVTKIFKTYHYKYRLT
jgi:hypothetical protein